MPQLASIFKEELLSPTTDPDTNLNRESGVTKEDVLPVGKVDLPEDKVFKFGDLKQASISGADIRGFEAEKEDGTRVKLVDVYLSKDIDKIREVSKGLRVSIRHEITENFPEDYQGTIFSDDPAIQKEIADFIKESPHFRRVPKDTVVIGNDYSGCRLDSDESESESKSDTKSESESETVEYIFNQDSHKITDKIQYEKSQQQQEEKEDAGNKKSSKCTDLKDDRATDEMNLALESFDSHWNKKKVTNSDPSS